MIYLCWMLNEFSVAAKFLYLFQDFENSEYSEFVYQKRIRCISETDDDFKQSIRKQNQSQIQKRFKQSMSLFFLYFFTCCYDCLALLSIKIIIFFLEFTTQNRPCLFFLQGNCCRPDCKYSHDLSTTTCRFWKEGSCFKGDTCPFFHGYIK